MEGSAKGTLANPLIQRGALHDEKALLESIGLCDHQDLRFHKSKNLKSIYNDS